MANLLTDKDRQWRKRPNGASPVFDPGLSSLGTDDEAGGSSAPPSDSGNVADAAPMSATPDDGSPGVRLPYAFWWTAVGLITAALVIAAVFSLS